ncbi:MAG: hypothetical protein CVV25_09790 [Ignavibacteriae bacterium HGW-Ignavibacteriae-4]|jgi:transcriptional regulator with XRE-family HTH domain|nr:MAG: hypothetical protein CVV25_09790 [Ignavibacteriae bacterium HGW-Ignavibacteriae-4]
MAGCNDSYIGQVERGSKNPSLEMLVNISNGLVVTVDYLLSDNVKIDQPDGMLDELLSLAKGRDPEDIRYLQDVF